MPENDVIIERLEEQISWYDTKSLSNQRTYKRVKVFEIIAAASIPFITPMPGMYVKWIVGVLGVLITVSEGIIQLNQYNKNWISYRATNEALKREKYLYLGSAGPYAGAAAANAHAMLAERVEGILAQETEKWVTLQENTRAATTQQQSPPA